MLFESMTAQAMAVVPTDRSSTAPAARLAIVLGTRLLFTVQLTEVSVDGAPVNALVAPLPTAADSCNNVREVAVTVSRSLR